MYYKQSVLSSFLLDSVIRVVTLCTVSVKLQRSVMPCVNQATKQQKREWVEHTMVVVLYLLLSVSSSRPVESLHPAVRAALVLSLPKPPVTTVRQRGATRGVRRASRNAVTFERELLGRRFA